MRDDEPICFVFCFTQKPQFCFVGFYKFRQKQYLLSCFIYDSRNAGQNKKMIQEFVKPAIVSFRHLSYDRSPVCLGKKTKTHFHIGRKLYHLREL